MTQLWQELKPGDRVRFTHMPTEFANPGYCLHQETRDAYQHVLDSEKAFEVRIEHDFPWIEFEIISDEGNRQYHSLMINHDGFERA